MNRALKPPKPKYSHPQCKTFPATSKSIKMPQSFEVKDTKTSVHEQ